MPPTDPSAANPQGRQARRFDEITMGETARVERVLTPESLQLFSALAGESGAQSADPGVAAALPRGRAFVAAGAWVGALITTTVAACLSGARMVCRGQRLRFPGPLRVGDRLRVEVVVAGRDPAAGHLVLRCVCLNQDGERVIEGEVEVAEDGGEGADVPQIDIEVGTGARRQRLLEHVRGLPAIRVAVVHPCDEASLTAALEAREAGLIEPVLVAPQARLAALAAQCGMDLAGIAIVDVPHSHAAAERAAELAGRGEVEALMKGSLHTDELMAAVVSAAGRLRTKRRISHCFVLQTPHYPRPVIVTDAAVNLAPGLEQKADIVRNAIDLAHVMGIPEPKVAILAAVETINPEMPATLDAAALCKMADRGQITGGLLDGPLAFDNAISIAAARTKGIVSPVAGQADILLVPDLESGNMLAKQLIYLGQAASAGIVLGARVPVILTSRADSQQARMASCALALMLAHHYRETPP